MNTATLPKFSATRTELMVIIDIANRAWPKMKDCYTGFHHLVMDIEATHCNGCRLRLDDLASAKDSDFIHDIAGIHNHLDRATGQLTGNFTPRYSA